MKLVRGNTEACFQHFAKAIEGPDFYKKRGVLASFANVTEQTVSRWIGNNYMPAGEPLLRLRFYLDFVGYDVEEVRNLQPEIRDAARILAFRLVSIDEVCDLVGYGGDSRSAIDTLLAVFRGVRNPSPEKLKQFASLAELYKEELDRKQRETEKVVNGVHTGHHFGVTAAAQLPTTLKQRTTVESHLAIMDAFTASMRAILPLAEYVLSNSFTAEERDRIRSSSGQQVSRLSLLLTQLSGEAARTALTNTSSKQ